MTLAPTDTTSAVAAPNRRLVSTKRTVGGAANGPPTAGQRRGNRPGGGAENTRSSRCYARTWMPDLRVTSAYRPTGDQPRAIAELAASLRDGNRGQTLLGATGTGKTATMAWLIEELQRPALVIAHNKTLAAQLCNEFREFFPGNAVEYFVSYYDYYQPEAYVPQADLYIEKDSSRNDDIDRLRHAASTSLVTRRDVVVVASVSCIYGIGSPAEYEERVVHLAVGEEFDRDLLLRKLVDIQYVRNDTLLGRGRFRVKGDVVELQPAYLETAYRISSAARSIVGFEVTYCVAGNAVRSSSRPSTSPVSGSKWEICSISSPKKEIRYAVSR